MRRAYKGAVMYMRLVDPASLLMLISRQLCGCRTVGRAEVWGGSVGSTVCHLRPVDGEGVVHLHAEYFEGVLKHAVGGRGCRNLLEQADLGVELNEWFRHRSIGV